MDFELEVTNCNLCGKSDTETFAKVSYEDYLKRRPEIRNDDYPILQNKKLAEHKFNLVRCRGCGLIYVNPRLSEKYLAQLFGEEYFSFYTDTQYDAHMKRQLTFKTEITELEKLSTGRKVLDVGCGGGFFLHSLNGLWEKWGTEINPAAVRFGKKEFGLNIIPGTLQEATFPAETFDVVKLQAVIEHLYDPKSELGEIHRILRRGGILAIQTPNIASICARLYHEKFRMVCPVQHLYYFSTKSLSQMLVQMGYKIKSVSFHPRNIPKVSLNKG